MIDKQIPIQGQPPYTGTIEFDGGIDLTDQYIEAVKKIDPSLKSIRIIMKGDFNRQIDKNF